MFLFSLLASIPIIIISGIRYCVGTDYYSIYWRGYEAVADGMIRVVGSKVSMERGFIFLVKIMQMLSKNPVTFFVITSIIIYGSLYIAVAFYSISPVMSIVFFLFSGLYFTSLNIVRQFFTIGVSLLLLKYVYKRQFFLFMVGVLFLSTIHMSILIIIPVYWLYKISLNPQNSIFLIGVSFCCSRIIYFVFSLILVNTRYVYYLDNSLYAKNVDISGIIYAMLITIISFFSYRNMIEKYKEKGQLFFNILIVFDVIVLLSTQIELANRIAVFFRCFSIVFSLPMIIKTFPAHKLVRIFIGAFFVLLFISATIFMYYYKGNADVFPYQTIFGRQ
ncbi:MAG: EpsG family protein [Clostridium sp.]|nr:EpsG family protein [Clostridium sp.]